MNYYDRYTSINADSLEDNEPIRSMYHTVAVTALFLAIKLHATSFEIVDDLQELRNRALSIILHSIPERKIILDMEMDILKALEWSVNPPTLHQFVFMFYEFHPSCESYTDSESYIYDATRYQVEIAIFVPHLLANYKPSIIAYAAMKNAEEMIAANSPNTQTMEMKQSYETLVSRLGVMVNSIAVAQCRVLLKKVCPELTDLDFFHNSITQITSIDMQIDRNLANSPRIVDNFVN